MKKFFVTFSIAILITTFVFALIPVIEASDIYDGIIRLHVIANSDSEEDQSLKLKVRDGILDAVDDMLGGAEDIKEACRALEYGLTDIEEIAAEVISGEGYDYPVSASLTVEYYPTREYDDLTLPRGEYRSLRVIIGSGEGKNWWCVLFPGVCKNSARVKEELAKTGFTPNQIRLITDKEEGGYTVRFRIVEFFSDMKYKIKKLFS